MAKVHEQAQGVEIVAQGRGANARTIYRTGGWELSKWGSFGDDEPRIRDTDLAVRLGFKQPRIIRQIIARNVGPGFQPGWRCAVQRQSTGNGGHRENKVNEYWLTEAEALFVATRSRTKAAVVLTHEMIGVYVAVRRGELAQPVPVRPSRLDALSAKVDRLTEGVSQGMLGQAAILDAVIRLTKLVGAFTPPEPPSGPALALARPVADELQLPAQVTGWTCVRPDGSIGCGLLHLTRAEAVVCVERAKHSPNGGARMLARAKYADVFRTGRNSLCWATDRLAAA